MAFALQCLEADPVKTLKPRVSKHSHLVRKFKCARCGPKAVTSMFAPKGAPLPAGAAFRLRDPPAPVPSSLGAHTGLGAPLLWLPRGGNFGVVGFVLLEMEVSK